MSTSRSMPKPRSTGRGPTNLAALMKAIMATDGLKRKSSPKQNACEFLRLFIQHCVKTFAAWPALAAAIVKAGDASVPQACDVFRAARIYTMPVARSYIEGGSATKPPVDAPIMNTHVPVFRDITLALQNELKIQPGAVTTAVRIALNTAANVILHDVVGIVTSAPDGRIETMYNICSSNRVFCCNLSSLLLSSECQALVEIKPKTAGASKQATTPAGDAHLAPANTDDADHPSAVPPPARVREVVSDDETDAVVPVSGGEPSTSGGGGGGVHVATPYPHGVSRVPPIEMDDSSDPLAEFDG